MLRWHLFIKWLVLASLIGVLSSFGAIIFFYMLEFSNSFLLGFCGGYISPTSQGEEHLFIFSEVSIVSWRIVIVITLGGLISGIIVYRFAPEAEGHGTDAYISAFHFKKGKIKGRIPIVKALSSAILIGAGGSAGREGPIAQIGAGGGSWLSSRLKLNERDRRIAIVCGAAAGIGAIFKAPLGGAIFAIEVLYKRDLESEGLLVAFISSTVSYSIFGLFFGFSPIFFVPSLVFDVSILGFFIILGLTCAPIIIFYVFFFYKIKEKVFNTKKIPKYIKPAIGCFFVGIIALIIPEILGPGYGIIQYAINGKLGLLSLIIIIFAKIIATSLTISSGGSGGVFAPSLVIGAMIGGALALIIDLFFPLSEIQKIAFIIVGMAAFVSGAASVLIAPIIMVSEMTGTYSLLVPSMIACTVSYVLTSKWTLYKSQLSTKARSPVHRGEFTIDILEDIRVSDIMTRDIFVLQKNDKIYHLSELINKTAHAVYPIVDNDQLVGVISCKDFFKIPLEKNKDITIGEVMSTNLFFIFPENNISEALLKMELHDQGQLCVVEKNNPKMLIGLISRQDIIKAHNLKRASIYSKHPRLKIKKKESK